MRIKEAIDKWVSSGKIFVQGVQIYKEIGGSYPHEYFEQYCQAPFVPTEVENNLFYFLSNYKGEKAITQAFIPNNTHTPAHRTQIPPGQEPQIILQLKTKAKSLHKHHVYLKGKLHNTSSEEKRYEIAHSIMERIIPEIDQVYQKINNYQDTGQLPSSQTDPSLVAEVVQKMQRRETLKSRLSRLKGLIKNATQIN